MSSQVEGCPYCKVVNIVCFWGALPKASWKRYALFIALAVVFLVANGILWFIWNKHGLLWFAQEKAAELLDYLLPVIVCVFLNLWVILNVLVCFKGCNACVARYHGSSF